MSDRFPEQMLQAGDSNLDPIAGAKLNFYITGTSTPKDTYSDSAKTIPNANPVVADAAGRFGDIFMDTDAAYKIVYTDASDVTIQTFDPFSPVRADQVIETPVVAKSANFTILTSQKGSLFEVDASSASVSATLPTVADAGNNFEVTIKKVDSSSNAVTVDGNGSETIDGSTTQTLSNQYDAITVVSDGTEWHVKSENDASESAPLPLNYITDLQVQINAVDSDHDIDASTGECRDSADGVNIVLASSLTKRADASWVAGDNQGGLSSSLTLSADTTYYAFAIVVAGVSDVGIDTSVTAANLVTDHSATAYRRIANILTDGSANLSRIDHIGEILQTVHVQDGAVATGTTTIPFDDTIPQSTEGDQYLNAKITPFNSNNDLIIEAVVNFAHSAGAGNWFTVALFQDSTADAIAVVPQTTPAANYGMNMILRHKMKAATVAETELKIRAGSQGAGTTTFNGQSGARRYGGVLASSLTITEISG